MWQDYLKQLYSADPDLRRQAIIAIGRSKDPAALGPLADVHRNDPDEVLRELALKAGRYIQSSGESAQPAPAPQPPHAPAPAQTPEPTHTVSPMAMEQAKGYFDRAVDYQVRGDDLKAIEMMGKALETNPALRHDVMFINMAIDLTGMGSGAAVATLADYGSRRDFMQQRLGQDGTPRRNVERYRTEDEATWGGALIDLSIYGLVNGAIVFVASLLAAEVIVGLLAAAMAASPASTTPESLSLLRSLETRQISLPLAGLYGLLTGVSAVIGLLISNVAIHLIATSVLGGAGTLAGLIRKTTLFYTVVLAVSLVLNIGLGALALDVDQNTYSSLSLVPTVLTLIMTVWAGKLTGDAYAFGTARGCASMALGYIALIVLFMCCAFTLSLAFAQAFQAIPQ